MLRPMRTPRRAWIPPLPLTVVMAVAVASPVAGCNKVKELTGQEEEKTEEPSEAPGDPVAEAEKADETPSEGETETQEG